MFPNQFFSSYNCFVSFLMWAIILFHYEKKNILYFQYAPDDQIPKFRVCI